MHYLYLHGFCSGENSYKGSYLRERFAETGLTLHTPDLNGGDFEHLTLTGQLDIVRALAAELAGDLILMGSSMGGYLATLFAEEQERVKRLVLIAPAFQFATRYLKRLDPAILQEWRERGYVEVYHYGYREQRRLHYGIVEDAKSYDQKPLRRQLPAVIFHGLHDDSVSYQLSIDYLDRHPRAQLLLLNADHQMTAEVELLWRYIRAFLEI